MKLKKIVAKSLIIILIISLLALGVLIFSGCTDINSESKNLSHYDLEIEYNDENKTLNCTQNLKYKNQSETVLNYICLNLYPNAFREDSISPPVSLSNQHKAYPNGKSYGEIEIKNVDVLNSTTIYCNSFNTEQPTFSEVTEYCRNSKLENNQYFIGGEDKNILYIIFNKPLYPDEDIQISIDFFITLPNINHRFGYGNNTVNLANFYPISCVFINGDFDKSLYHYNGDPFYSDMSNYDVIIKYPDAYKLASTGEQIETKNDNGFLTTKIEAKLVRDFAIVLSKEFNIISDFINSTEVKYYYFSDEDPNQSLKTSLNALSFFNNLIGDYPYSTLSVVEANFVHGGMEFPNLVYISNDINDRTTYNQVIVHEIAHQWWYNMVGSSAYKNGWLDEGLTEYSTALFFEANPEYNLNKDTIISNAYSSFSLFVNLYENVYGNIDTSMNRPLNEFKSEQEYVYIAYVKGMLLFDSLREILGEKQFKKCLKDYFNDYKFKNVTPDNLIASFEKSTGKALINYFYSWINGNIVILK